MNPTPPPFIEPIAGKQEATDPWQRWFADQGQRLSQAPNRFVAPISLTNQNASIVSTAICSPQTAAGLYRLTYYTRITTPGSVSSSLTVTLDWKDHTIAQSFSGAAMTGNTDTTLQSNTQTVYIDAGSGITYSTSYASNLAGEMIYQLYVMIEAVAL